jgi:hypothetical protein
VFSPAKVVFTGFSVLLLVCIFLNPFVPSIVTRTNASQTAKKVGADEDALVEIFERMEAFFQRLETYNKVAPNQGMMATITAIMVEVLNVLAIATKEIKQGRMSKSFLYKFVRVYRTIFRKIPKEIDWKERY